MPIDFSNLKYFNPIRDKAHKSISLLFPVKLDDIATTSTIIITDSGIDVNRNPEENITTLLQNYLQDSRALPIQPFLFIVNQFPSPRKEHSGFELLDRSRTLCIAISILTGKACFEWANFQYNNATDPPLYYKPYVFKDDVIETTYFDKPAVLSAETDLEPLRLIYSNLTQLGIWKWKDDKRVSKLLNATRFYVHFNEEKWILQKIVFAFVVLESLFGAAEEITEKVAIRTAYFLYPDNINARHGVYKLLKIAYSVRSKFVHGSKINKVEINNRLRMLKQNIHYNLEFELLDDLRDITSQALQKIFTDTSYFEFFSKEKFKNGEEDDFYNQLVLGHKDK